MSRILRFLILGVIGLVTLNLQMRLLPHRVGSRPLVMMLAVISAGLHLLTGEVGGAAFLFAVAAVLLLAKGWETPQGLCFATAYGYIFCLLSVLMLAGAVLAGPAGATLMGVLCLVAPLIYLRRIREHQARLVRSLG